ncbi:hypothetical protein [Accumulibacter sp.]|uniref:hypothetical protein n=1 Tax=Accumulibacter sp. TaxID=2053492 RepID=UPI0025C72A69|nr:hypothetical protein [Accumulibacter sp.]
MPDHTRPPAFLPGARRLLCAAGAALLALPGQAETLLCHLTYGGETRLLRAAPVSTPYAVPVQAIGSYFLFRMVFQKEPADLAAIKLYVFTERANGAAPILQVTHPYPPVRPASAAYGFTGLNSVYEPIRDGELQFWCELSAAPGGAA